MTAAKLAARLSLPHPTRNQRVWASLLAAMTLVGGLLLALENRPIGGTIAPALVEIGGASKAPNLAKAFETTAPLDRTRWQGIVIHHSTSAVGSAETVKKQHEARGFKGLGYHFVISNGQGAPDGQISIGSRWQYQLPGVHVTGPRAEEFNRQTIGICLIGDGDRRPFSEAQLAGLTELVSQLQRELRIDDQHVFLNREVSKTSGPGRLFPEAAFRQKLTESR